MIALLEFAALKHDSILKEIRGCFRAMKIRDYGCDSHPRFHVPAAGNASERGSQAGGGGFDGREDEGG